MKWNPVLECDDDDDNPTVWATEINNEYGKFIWIEKHDEHEFHITVCDPEWRTLMIRKSLASAKRWVSMKMK